MKINIHGDKIKVTDSIKNYVELKIGKLDKYFEDSEEIIATTRIKVKGETQCIEVTIPIKKFTIRAEEKHKDLYAAIDLVIDKIESQIRKNKNRIRDRYKKQDTPDFIFDFEDIEKNDSKIVKRKNVEIKPMDEEEAILQMELLGHDFFVFNNIDESAFSVLYKRKDGNYGIINTK